MAFAVYTADALKSFSHYIMAIKTKPKVRKHARAHGFLKRMSSTNGKNTIKRRMHKGRKKLSA